MTDPTSGTPRPSDDPDFDPVAHPELAPEVDDPQVWLDQFLAEAQQMQAQAEQAERQYADISTTVENKFMRLTMAAGGTITSLTFLGSANAATAAQLTDAFRETQAQAGAEVARRSLAVMTTLAGPDDPAVRAVEQSLPEEVCEQMAAENQDPSLVGLDPQGRPVNDDETN